MPGIDFTQLRPHIDALRAAGKSQSEAAHVLGVSMTALSKFLAREEYDWSRSPGIRDATARALSESGLTYAQIASIMGITRDGARGMAHRARRVAR